MSTTLQQQTKLGIPEKQGLYDPVFEKDSCGVGFVANIKGKPSHQIVVDAEIMLQRMEHRGGSGCEPNTGDGAGILTGMPHAFFKKVAKQDLAIDLPALGRYAVANIFLPTDEKQRLHCIVAVERLIQQQKQQCLGWREVPIDTEGADIGPTARLSQPVIMQLFVGADENATDEKHFERQLYVIRKRCSHLLRYDKSLSQRKTFYICSLSPRVIIYKGMLNALQVKTFYLDLQDTDYTSHIAMVHSRFSTNTFPSWDRAQPNRYMSHNGEINTLLGNRNWMSARQGMVKCDDYHCEIESLFPIAENDCSDSGNFDNVLEFLLMSGRSLPEAVMLMVPEAWQSDTNMSQDKKDFYRFNSAMMEPWDGPASIAFTNGHCIGAVLDRNGLRPSRYYLTHDDRVIMASEVGVVDVAPEDVKFKGRLQPGKMFLIDFDQGKLISDETLKKDYSTRRPYGQWLKNQEVKLADLCALVDNKSPAEHFDATTLIAKMKAFGYTTETMQFMLLPLVRELRDPVGSMGNDSALACLSDKPRMIYDYFKQLFAQVTNPAIDSIREEVVMSLECYIGPEGNLLDTTEQHAHRLRIPHPILTNQELSALKQLDYKGWKAKTLDITFDKTETAGLENCLDNICRQASAAIDEGYSLVILSDRNLSAKRVAASTLLATGAVHHHLVKNQQRTRIGIVLETGEAREVHQHCLLIGYGADAINPYLAFEALFQSKREGLLADDKYNDEMIVAAYRKGVGKGMLKVMAKIGISTLHSYKGAQIFEAVGLGEDVIERCFKGTASRIKGVSLNVLAEELLRRHKSAYPSKNSIQNNTLDNPGDFHWRSGGEVHMWNPETLANIQLAARTNSKEAYQLFAKVSDDDSTRRATLRGLLKFKTDVNGGAISIDEVEPAKEIVKRFVTGAMSFGSISAESHEALAIAMNRMGGKSNTGEGGEDAKRFTPMENGDSKRSAIKQIASGRFGVTNWYLTNADELQIKVSQGAKPGEGGELPGGKVDANIARIRHSTPGVGLISPPPHHDIYSIEDLAQLIHDLKNANPSARISVKLVAEIGVGTIASGVVKAFADHLVIAGHDGGTGASPLTSVKHAGLPWELGVAETHQTLVMNNLRSRVVLQTDGQLKTGRDITIAALLGAEEFGFSTAPLITLGCIMMRKCHLNTCPVGIATQDKELRKKFKGKPEHVVNYLFMVAEDMREHMASLGFKTVNEMIGRVDVLEPSDVLTHWKAKGIDLSALLSPAQKPHNKVDVFHTQTQNHGLEKALDNEIIKRAKATIEKGKAVSMELPIVNTNRVVGTMLSHELAKARQGKPLKDGTVNIKLNGSAGQSLGAWLYQGVTIELEGDANDYAGKGLSGGRLIVYPPKNSCFIAEENIIVGNTVLYGATSGEAYFRGIAAERFCVRNSGAKTVIEGVGDHGCEYMTGGRVVVLGKTGRNFAAGMSGGIAYIWDKNKNFKNHCNMEMVELEKLEDEQDIDELKTLIENHQRYTSSSVATRLLNNWQQSIEQFIKVMPTDYKRVLQQTKQQQIKAVA